MIAVSAVVCALAGLAIWLVTRNSGPSRTSATRTASAPGRRVTASATADSSPSAGARQSPSPATPSPTPPPPVIHGSSVTAIGDSVMVASTPALEHALPGIYINATVSRQFSAGLQVLATLKAENALRPVVIFALGTNGTVTPDEIAQLYSLIGPGRRLVLVNTYEARSWEYEVNSTLARAARQHADTVLANWHATISRHLNLLWPDEIHPQPAGAVLYAKMIKAALERLAARTG
ncbi:MAG: SGNH/GDSL hydrolase family protein [Streptosporangiaceae bacterium]